MFLEYCIQFIIFIYLLIIIVEPIKRLIFFFQCYFLEWSSIFIPDPPESSSIIEDTELSEIQNQVKLCLSETYELAEYLHDKGEGSVSLKKRSIKNKFM